MKIRNEVPNQACVNYRNFDPLNSEYNLDTHFNNKPKLALWTCDDYEKDIREIGWIMWNIGEYFENMDNSLLKSCLYRLYPKKGLKVLEIDSLEDLDTIPKVVTNNGNFNEIKFDYKEMVKQGFDGMHITWHGAGLGHGFNESLTITLAMSSFDCESTVWFHSNWIERFELVDPNLIQTLKNME